MTPEELVAALEDLHRGDEAVLQLVYLGEEAVDALARFLLGPPGLHAQPRILAAEALGLIGGARATEALATALVAGDLTSLDPVVRLSEDAVREVMARELGRLGGPRVVEPLLEALRRFRVLEAGLALARLHERRALPLLVACLEDSFRRERAGAALVEFGPGAIDALIESLGRPLTFAGEEIRPSLERRTESARLLGALGDSRAVPALREGLTDGARSVRIAAAVALTRLGVETPADVLPALLEGVRSDDPSVGDECEATLVGSSPIAVPVIVDAFSDEADRAAARGETAPTPALRRLARVLSAQGDPGIAALCELSHDTRAVVRGLAIAHLGQAPASILDVVLGAATHDPDRRVRRTAEGLQQAQGECERGAPSSQRWSRTVRRGWGAVLKRLDHG